MSNDPRVKKNFVFIIYIFHIFVRQHDLGCPAAIQPGETILGLENDRYFTMMHCSCDER